MKTSVYLTGVAAVALLLTSHAFADESNTHASSPSFAGHQLAGSAKVSLAQARAIALKARPGTITSEELERESGGSGLRYSFDVRSAGKLWEVGVDARTGQVLENDRESDHPD